MRTIREIKHLLDELDSKTADALEAQDLDFKEWNTQSMGAAVNTVIDWAVCMANGGGGTVVFGIDNDVVGREIAIIGVPSDVEVNRLKKAVYDSTDPKLTPVFDELTVKEGTGRLLVMQIFPGLPPYTDTSGRGKIRIGRDCKPLTGSLRNRIMVETGESDLTAKTIPGRLESHISPSAIEQLREAARLERAPNEVIQLGDYDLLEALGVIRDGQLTTAGLITAGREESIREHLPGYQWTYLRMRGSTDYSDRIDGCDSLPVALIRINNRIMADNPITTLKHGMFHFEYRTYPEIAIREALMNAFCHADYRLAGPIFLRQYSQKLEISNPGGFIGGISPENILHHTPVARNPHLVDVLTRLRLVNRSNLGIPRMFFSLLAEGKEPPVIEEKGDSVQVTFLSKKPSASFKGFIAEEEERGRVLSVDHLLVLQHLLRHAEIETAIAANICQRSETEAREILSDMELSFEYLERGGTGRGTYWTLRSEVHHRISAPGHPDRDRRMDWEAAKTRILSILKQRAERDEPGLANRDVRQITHLSRHQVLQLITELRQENPKIVIKGHGRGAKYIFSDELAQE